MEPFRLTVVLVIGSMCSWSPTESRTPGPASSRNGVLAGVRARVTQKGLDYGSELAVDMLMKNKEKMVIPEFRVAVGGSTLTLSNMVIKELPRPQLKISLMPNRTSPVGRLRVDVTDLHPIIDADMKIEYTSWLLSTSREGSVTSTSKNMTVTLEAGLDIDLDGRPLPKDVQCNVEGDLDFELTGEFQSWSSVVSTVFDTLREHIKPAIFDEICANILRDVNKSLEVDLKTVLMSVPFENDYEFDYRLVRPPYITSRFIETSHKGGIYLRSRTSDPPFLPHVIPHFPHLTDRMAYVFVTEYVANTGWHAALNNGQLRFSTGLNASALPPVGRRFLSTTCPGSTCLGSVFPQLAWLYPDSVAGVDVYATNSSRPVFRLRGRSIRVRCEGVAEFYMETSRSRDHILTVNITLTGSVDVSISDNKLIFNVNSISADSDVRKSSLGLMLSLTEFLFDAYLRTTSQFVLLPALQAVGLRGVPLDVPDVPELKFINPVVVEHNVQGVLVVGTDVQYTVPTLN